MAVEKQKIYFLSDFHLGAPDAALSLLREKKIIAFLDEIKQEAAQIFILGDLFDFWLNTAWWFPGAMYAFLANLLS